MVEDVAEDTTLPHLGMLTSTISKPTSVRNASMSYEQRVCMSSVSVLLLSFAPAFASNKSAAELRTAIRKCWTIIAFPPFVVRDRLVQSFLLQAPARAGGADRNKKRWACLPDLSRSHCEAASCSCWLSAIVCAPSHRMFRIHKIL